MKSPAEDLKLFYFETINPESICFIGVNFHIDFLKKKHSFPGLLYYSPVTF